MSGQGLDRRSIVEASREAATKETKFEAKDRANYIRKEVAGVRAMFISGKTDQEVKEHFALFATNYPTLFEYACKPQFDEGNLNLMLGLLDRMGDKAMSQHQASVVVGQRMAERYIRPSR